MIFRTLIVGLYICVFLRHLRLGGSNFIIIELGLVERVWICYIGDGGKWTGAANRQHFALVGAIFMYLSIYNSVSVSLPISIHPYQFFYQIPSRTHTHNVLNHPS